MQGLCASLVEGMADDYNPVREPLEVCQDTAVELETGDACPVEAPEVEAHGSGSVNGVGG